MDDIEEEEETQPLKHTEKPAPIRNEKRKSIPDKFQMFSVCLYVFVMLIIFCLEGYAEEA